MRRKYQGVTAYDGLPGSGKTYSLAEIGCEAIDRGREVFSNDGFSLAGSKIYGGWEEFVSVWVYARSCVERGKQGPVVLLDEAPTYFNARRWQEFPDVLLYELTQIRKNGAELHWSTVDWMMTDVTLRRLTFWTWECRALAGRLLVKERWPTRERRKADDRRRERRFYRVRNDIAHAYDTMSKVAGLHQNLTVPDELRLRWEMDPPSLPPVLELVCDEPGEASAPAEYPERRPHPMRTL